MEKTRIQKLLSNYSTFSRREVEKLIQQKKVYINNEICKLGDKATIDDKIVVNNKKINFKLSHKYYLLNKPKGFICSRVDPKFHRTAISLVPQEDKRNIFTVGRLDVLTTGLIIVTTDGELSNIIQRPSSKIPKTYLVWLKNDLTDENIMQINKGIKISKSITTKKPKKILIPKIDNRKFIKLTIIEGKNNQIRKMFKELGNEVVNLKRTNIGFLSLDNIAVGEYAKISRDKIYDSLLIH